MKMKKFLAVLVMLLLLGGGGYGIYDYLMGGFFFPKEQTLTLEIDDTPKEEIIQGNLIEIRSFKVPVLHNAQAVKFLVFHVILDVESKRDRLYVQQKMNNLVDMYIRYLIAHFEVNSVGDVLSRRDMRRILRTATQEVMGDLITLNDVIIQGVYQKYA